MGTCHYLKLRKRILIFKSKFLGKNKHVHVLIFKKIFSNSAFSIVCEESSEPSGLRNSEFSFLADKKRAGSNPVQLQQKYLDRLGITRGNYWLVNVRYKIVKCVLTELNYFLCVQHSNLITV